MALRSKAAILFVLFAIAFFASIHRHFPHNDPLSDDVAVQLPRSISHPHHAIHENLTNLHSSRRVSSVTGAFAVVSTFSVLLPDWEVLVIVSSDSRLSLNYSGEYKCLFQNNYTSPALPTGILPFSDRQTFKCVLPETLRRRQSRFRQPVFVPSSSSEKFPQRTTSELPRWSFLVYGSLSTEDDVVLFVKGVNKRQGIDRPPGDLRCVFGDEAGGIAVRTAVTSSNQEVFRCEHPDAAEERIVKVSLEIPQGKKRVVVPSVAYYTRKRTVPSQEKKLEICACTMVYNVEKFLKEWMMYYSQIGVEKFILYDNDSDDDLQGLVKELQEEEKFDVNALFWPWPKAQEAGFSHCAVYAKDTCKWMMYIDVDEFVYSPKWKSEPSPSTSRTSSNSKLRSLLDIEQQPGNIGQISIGCYEFGPSNLKSHPIMGVIQGYNCRRRTENRHKSIVLLDAVDESLLNSVHHFRLKEGYRGKKLSVSKAVVNHYKYQAWPEFKAKFRRRVSTYVKDWTETVNPNSKDRAPGLGFAPVEPKRWPQMFCEVVDNRLKELTRISFVQS